jgi:hypothetical protein
MEGLPAASRYDVLRVQEAHPALGLDEESFEMGAPGPYVLDEALEPGTEILPVLLHPDDAPGAFQGFPETVAVEASR